MTAPCPTSPTLPTSSPAGSGPRASPYCTPGYLTVETGGPSGGRDPAGSQTPTEAGKIT